MLLRFSVIADADKQDSSAVFGEFSGVFSGFDLIDGALRSVVIFQLDEQRRAVCILSGQKGDIRETFSCREFPDQGIIFHRAVVGERDDTA